MRSSDILNKLKNRKIIVTAGGTTEPIDPVRYIGNYSSGKMGIALASAFARYSSHVLLIHAGISVPVPKNIKTLPVRTVDEMYETIRKQLTVDSILVMSAAVSDFKVRNISKIKIKKNKKIMLELVPAVDILKNLSKIKTGKNIFIGFALETGDIDIIDSARKKLKEKKLDLIAANPLSSRFNPFGSGLNKVYLIDKARCIELPLMKKIEIARRIVKYVCTHILK